MQKVIHLMISSFLMMSLLGGCMKSQADESQETIDNLSFIVDIDNIPEEYKQPAAQAGELVRLEYTTYESKTYESQQTVINKNAYVYIPFGYDEQSQYNIFYLMHGGWSNETTILGTEDHPSELKYAIDHAIQNGQMVPMIIVCPTYNNESSSDSDHYQLALTLTNNYHNELINDLIPAVESQYSTYAQATTKEGLRASRDHRGFGGFSMGSVATWHTFEYCLDYFRYFMPMSGSLTTNGDYFNSIVEESGYTWNDFYIYAFSGTEDFAYQSLRSQILSMLHGSHFIYGDEGEGNLNFQVKSGGVHSLLDAYVYTYNGLLWFWNH